MQVWVPRREHVSSVVSAGCSSACRYVGKIDRRRGRRWESPSEMWVGCVWAWKPVAAFPPGTGNAADHQDHGKNRDDHSTAQLAQVLHYFSVPY